MEMGREREGERWRETGERKEAELSERETTPERQLRDEPDGVVHGIPTTKNYHRI